MSSSLRALVCYLGFAGLALLAYSPALTGGFLWDDTDWIRDNQALRSVAGLWRIWFEPGAVIQYYPLTYTSWWLDCQLWGLSPTVMHVENVLLHAANALLFATLLRRLALPAAMFAGLVFLLHPVHSESVAWLVERKNTLSGLFYLAACHAWLSHLDRKTRGSLMRTLLLFVAALLAKTATLLLPVTLLAIAIWQRREWRLSLRSLAPFVLLTVLFAVVTIVMERGEGAVGHDWALSVGDRALLLGQVLGFYLGKLLLPTAVLGLALAASVWVVWRSRRPAAIACCLALWIYVANLLPVSGLVDYYYLRYAFAADHFQYLPSLGPIALWCCGGALLLRKVRVAAVVAAMLLLLLTSATWNRAGTYSDLETLWRATIASEPDAWLAHSNLGNLLASQRGPDAGIEHHQKALAIYPDAFESNNAVGNYHVRRGEWQAASECFARALRVRPQDPLTYNNQGAMFGSQGNYAEALRCFEAGHQRAPANRDLLRNLAVVLSQAPDEAVRDGVRALTLAIQLNDVAQPSLADEHVLFRAMLLAGDRQTAIVLGERVLQRAQRERNAELAARVGAQMRRLRR